MDGAARQAERVAAAINLSGLQAPLRVVYACCDTPGTPTVPPSACAAPMAVLRVQCQAARPLAAAAAQRRAPAPSSSRFAGVSVPRAAPRVRSRPRQVAVAGLFGLGVPELAVIAGVAALIFGER